MGPENNSAQIHTMITTPPPSPPLPRSPVAPFISVACPAPPPCSPCPSPPPPMKPSPAHGGVTLRALRNRHLAHLDPWRRHSWEPGAAVQGCPQNENRSVSLEDLDPEEMEKLLGGALGPQRGQDPRRVPIVQYGLELGSLQSLTEEEAGPEPQHYSILEDQSSQLQGCSASAPSLCAEVQTRTRTRSRSPRPAPRPRSHCYETSLYSQIGGSTHSVDAEGEGEDEEGTERENSSTLERTLSFLRKMAGNRKKCRWAGVCNAGLCASKHLVIISLEGGVRPHQYPRNSAASRSSCPQAYCAAAELYPTATVSR
ncbi:hypothetical protein SKAU_G00406950 [Synaphobranchus kaupii]|uniref:Uncharacterized protein n=1 Tax=Synaphobranchus kaupii TaxID=118154 RepID=A0A9Q1ICY5_SYNKA|nr:hypothetical protein SKAU_G00406950 [Synaphobranchus kaupii]